MLKNLYYTEPLTSRFSLTYEARTESLTANGLSEE